MRIALIVFSLILLTSATENHQDFVNSADTNQEEEKSTSGAANHPYGNIRYENVVLCIRMYLYSCSGYSCWHLEDN